MAKKNTVPKMLAVRAARDVMIATWLVVSDELVGGFRPLREQALYDALIGRTMVEAERLGSIDVMLYLINNPAGATQLASMVAK